jgi:hypothetical protein
MDSKYILDGMEYIKTSYDRQESENYFSIFQPLMVFSTPFEMSGIKFPKSDTQSSIDSRQTVFCIVLLCLYTKRTLS